MMTTIKEDEEGENRVENSMMDRQAVVLLSQTADKNETTVKREITFQPKHLDSFSTLVQSNVA